MSTWGTGLRYIFRLDLPHLQLGGFGRCTDDLVKLAGMWRAGCMWLNVMLTAEWKSIGQACFNRGRLPTGMMMMIDELDQAYFTFHVLKPTNRQYSLAR